MVLEYAESVARNSGSAIALTKSLLAASHGMSLEAGLEYAASMNALARATDDMKKGVAKFLAKASK
jgi:methylglutaconyl-CoA hydratase